MLITVAYGFRYWDSASGWVQCVIASVCVFAYCSTPLHLPVSVLNGYCWDEMMSSCPLIYALVDQPQWGALNTNHSYTHQMAEWVSSHPLVVTLYTNLYLCSRGQILQLPHEPANDIRLALEYQAFIYSLLNLWNLAYTIICINMSLISRPIILYFLNIVNACVYHFFIMVYTCTCCHHKYNFYYIINGNSLAIYWDIRSTTRVVTEAAVGRKNSQTSILSKLFLEAFLPSMHFDGYFKDCD